MSKTVHEAGRILFLCILSAEADATVRIHSTKDDKLRRRILTCTQLADLLRTYRMKSEGKPDLLERRPVLASRAKTLQLSTHAERLACACSSFRVYRWQCCCLEVAVMDNLSQLHTNNSISQSCPATAKPWRGLKSECWEKSSSEALRE